MSFLRPPPCLCMGVLLNRESALDAACALDLRLIGRAFFSVAVALAVYIIIARSLVADSNPTRFYNRTHTLQEEKEHG